jgi:hypothetical protein
MRALAKMIPAAVAAAMVLGALAPQAEARRGRGPTWVPGRAWKAVQRYAKKRYDPRAKLFKTHATRAHSLGLKGAVSKAWIVGARAPQRPRPPAPGFMPYKPRQTYYLVTKGKNRRWQVTPLAGMGSYLTRVDAGGQNPRVGVGVALQSPGQVGHGVEVKNTLGLKVTRGTALARKRNGGSTHTVYLKGDTGGQKVATNARGTLRAYVGRGGRFGGVPLPREIDVNFSQVFFARPLAQR